MVAITATAASRMIETMSIKAEHMNRAGRVAVRLNCRCTKLAVWVLLLFAAWTLLLLFVTIGYFRWSRILTSRATMREWRPDEVQGTDWYRRAMRAHANCLENLPIYSAITTAVRTSDHLGLLGIGGDAHGKPFG